MDINTILEPELESMGFFELSNELEQIGQIQQFFANQFTFENLDVLLKNKETIDEAFLINKLLVQKRGGLCYELNGTLYLVLKALGFEVTLTSATIWTGYGWGVDRTHTIVIFHQHNRLYLVDSGTGTNLPMKPLPLDGEPALSPAGAFRLRTSETDKGSITAERLTDDGWISQYTFDPAPVNFHDDLNRSKTIIHELEASPFNKALLIAKAIPDGTISINDERISRKWTDEKGLMEREERTDFKDKQDTMQAVRAYGSEATYKAVERYLF